MTEGLTKARATIPVNMDLKTSSIPGNEGLFPFIVTKETTHEWEYTALLAAFFPLNSPILTGNFPLNDRYFEPCVVFSVITLQKH